MPDPFPPAPAAPDRFEAWARLSSAGVAVMDNGKLIWTNPRLCELTGLTETELRARENVLNLWEGEGRVQIRKAMATLLEGVQESVRLRVPLRAADGARRDTQVSLARLAAEGKARLFLEVVDETEAVRVKADYEILSERFRYMARATQELVWEARLPERALWCNESIKTLFRFPEDQVPATLGALLERVAPEDRERITGEVEKMIEKRSPLWIGDFAYLRGDGRIARVLARAFLLQDKQHRPVRLIGSMLDNTHQKELEERLQEGQRLMSVGAMVGGLANQTNNILSPILAAAEALEENPLLDDHQRGLLDIVRHNCLRGRDLMFRILDHTTGQSNAPHPVDLGPLVANVLEMARNTFPKNISFEVGVAADLPRPFAGDLDVQQVLLGMCVHLRNALSRGGRIRLHANPVKLDEGFASHQNKASPGAYLKVRAEGEGSGAGAADSGGGLAALHDLASEAGGFLNAFSETDSTRLLELFLPVGREDQRAGEEADDEAPILGHGETLLLVDDEVAFRTLAGKFLEMHGYQVLPAENGAEAISVFFQQRHEIALVIMDLDMPVMDGITAIRTLREIQPRLKVIASTGSVRRRVDLKADGVDVNGLLRKPYPVKELLREIDRALR